MWRSRVYWGHFEKADRKSNEFQIPAPPKKSKIRSREGDPGLSSDLSTVLLFHRTTQQGQGSDVGGGSGGSQMDTFSDSFGEKFPRGKEEKEGKVGDVS